MPLVPIRPLTGCISAAKQVFGFVTILAVVAVWSGVSFVLMLALQSEQPYNSAAPKGRCVSLFADASDATNTDTTAHLGFRYSAGHSAVLACTDKSDAWWARELSQADAKSFDPWQEQAVIWEPKCNLSMAQWREYARVTASTPIQCPNGEKTCTTYDGNPLDVTPAQGGPWWAYTMTFNSSFKYPECGENSAGITLLPNQLDPMPCDRRFVWAFEHNNAALMLYFQLILVFIFVPQFYYLYCNARFWWNIDDVNDHAIAARFYEDAQKGIPAGWFVLRAAIKAVRKTNGPMLHFIENHVVIDQLPPVGRKVFALDSFASLAEVSFGAIALFGCHPQELQHPTLAMIAANLAKSTIFFFMGAHAWWTRRESRLTARRKLAADAAADAAGVTMINTSADNGSSGCYTSPPPPNAYESGSGSTQDVEQPLVQHAHPAPMSPLSNPYPSDPSKGV
jgi:hypothetical protein